VSHIDKRLEKGAVSGGELPAAELELVQITFPLI